MRKGSLLVVLFCISLMTDDVEHLFLCTLAICISSFENCLFKSIADVLNFFLSLNISLIYIQDTSLYQIYDLQIYFLLFCGGGGVCVCV